MSWKISTVLLLEKSPASDALKQVYDLLIGQAKELILLTLFSSPEHIIGMLPTTTRSKSAHSTLKKLRALARHHVSNAWAAEKVPIATAADSIIPNSAWPAKALD